jgi:phosphoribosylformimino-5-aminoimidazole carboxamide ribotide isomerase
MLIPSIDLMGGRVVQLQQGERLALAFDDLDAWIDRFAPFPVIQVIDLDAAMGHGNNDQIVRRLCGLRPCQVGGGVRTIDRARVLLDAGAHRIILGSSLFTADGVNAQTASMLAQALGSNRLIAAIDSRAGRVVINGWKTALPLSPEQAARSLEEHVATFLYTHVDTEGLLGGIDMTAVQSVARATTRRLIVAGGIRNQAEVDELEAEGIDAVVGMAIYSGTFR